MPDTVKLEIVNCVSCPHHKTVSDPDPDDWFCDDDEKLLCCNVSHKEVPRVIASGLRPYETKHVEIPSWCPLRKK